MRTLVLSLMSIFAFATIQCLLGITFACCENESVISIEGGEKMQPGEAEYIPDELLVKFKKGVNAQDISVINEDLGTEVVNVLGEGLLYQVKISPSAKLDEVRKAYETLSTVEYAEVNYVVGIEPQSSEVP